MYSYLPLKQKKLIGAFYQKKLSKKEILCAIY